MPDGEGVATREANPGEGVASRETIDEVPCSCEGCVGRDGSRRIGVVAALEEGEVIVREDSNDEIFVTYGGGAVVGSGRLRGLESKPKAKATRSSCSWLLLREAGGVGKWWLVRLVGFVRPGGFPLSSKSFAELT